jgi:hypothetical protein
VNIENIARVAAPFGHLAGNAAIAVEGGHDRSVAVLHVVGILAAEERVSAERSQNLTKLLSRMNRDLFHGTGL